MKKYIKSSDYSHWSLDVTSLSDIEDVIFEAIADGTTKEDIEDYLDELYDNNVIDRTEYRKLQDYAFEEFDRFIKSHESKPYTYAEPDGYWYLSKHGVGPGMIPRGVSVLEVVDHPTSRYKCYIKLDRFLTTQELRDYELKEEAPIIL